MDDNEIVRTFIEKFNQEVKFYDTYLLYNSNKLYRYKSIEEISIFFNENNKVYVNICNNTSRGTTTIYRCYESISAIDLLTIKIRIIDIFMTNMNKMSSSNKQLEEISKKMDAINEKLDAIVYAPGSSLYKEIASKYAKDEKK